METFEIELMYEISGIKRIPIEAKSYKEALKKFKKQYNIPDDEYSFDGMVTGPELDLSVDIDSIEVEIIE